MKVLRWIGIVLVIVLAGIFGRCAGHFSGKATAQVSKTKQQYYAVSKAKSQRTGRIIVSIVRTDDKNDCAALLSGRREGAANPANPMTIESAQCATEIGAHWLAAFDNKPVAGAYYVAYTNVVWPTRELFFDIDPSRPSEEVCRLLVSLYTPIDSKVRCVPPSRP